MRKHNRTCEFDAYRHAITEALTRAVQLDKGRKARMQKDPDLDPVRDTIAYQLLLGVDPTTKDGFTKLLENVTWWGPGVGAYGSRHGVDFGPKGEATWWHLQVNEETGASTRKTFKAKWKVTKPGAVTLELPARGDLPAETVNGTLDGVRLKFGDAMELLDEPAECDA